MQQEYPSLEVKEYEIYLNEGNRKLFKEMANSYNTEIKGVPTIFINDRVIIGFSSSLEKDIENEIQKCLKEKCTDPFLRANGEATQIIGDKSPSENPEETEKLSFPKIISLAAVDAINPCALAVLTLMLITILTYNPKNKKRILYSGLAFTLSVFMMYFIYGLIIIKFFQLIQGLSSVRVYLYKCLGVAAIIIGSLNIRDYISYKPGNVATEMPLMMRPKVQKIISKITSPKGAFTAGLFVTVFLLPCTIGPYIIAGGILSAMEIIKTIPPLILYNAIFVLPMIIITGLVYKGISKVEDVSGWKDKNIKILHLVAGIIMALLGITMLTGWI
jgi:cytochrome c biogenesis protein CcdA/glutaredoxin